jgi:predicted ABC-type ATPase
MTDILDRRPILVAIAGPNGAGKSTLYRSQLAPSGLPFVNADDLSMTLGIDPYHAAEVADSIRKTLVAQGESFIFETVFSDPVGDKLDFLKDAERRGYAVVLLFVGIDSYETSEERVSLRVMKGGHDVPREKLASRYIRVLENLRRALKELSNVRVYDNSDMRDPYRLVVRRDRGGALEISQPIPKWLAPLLPPS